MGASKNSFMKKFCLLLFTSALLLLSGSGCAWFRSMFNEPERPPKRASSEKRSRKRPAADDDRDPIHDLFKIKNKPEYMHDKDLSPRERELLKQELNNNDPERAVRDFRSDYKSEKQKRRDWVFGR